MEDLEQILAFMREAEGLKTVERRINTSRPGRTESSAEHSFSALLLLRVLKSHILSDYPGIDFEKLTDMVTVHDLPEVYAGDTFLYDEEARRTISSKEASAAIRLFQILGSDGPYYLRLWQEYEEGKTTEARLAKKIDYLDATLQNIKTNGSAWRPNGITVAMIEEKLSILREGDDVFSRIYNLVMKEIKDKNLTGED